LQRAGMEARERQALEDAAPMLGAELTGERVLDGERRILTLLTRRPTEQRFPRRNGVPEKRPLCL
jgi:hypothetical protein